MPTIAVVATGRLMPGATSLAGSWQNILAPTYARRSAFLPDAAVDTLGFGIPTLLPATDTSQLLLWRVAQSVLDDVPRAGATTTPGCAPRRRSGGRFGRPAARASWFGWRRGQAHGEPALGRTTLAAGRPRGLGRCPPLLKTT